ncbi:hypothetical protein GQ53DRAFT_304852 [Thozetella sp. PMI_491]|nr:hypothetical protein GQ53DRAFT_304852 [Thozetella sp. PMI_491]
MARDCWLYAETCHPLPKQLALTRGPLAKLQFHLALSSRHRAGAMLNCSSANLVGLLFMHAHVECMRSETTYEAKEENYAGSGCKAQPGNGVGTRRGLGSFCFLLVLFPLDLPTYVVFLPACHRRLCVVEAGLGSRLFLYF